MKSFTEYLVGLSIIALLLPAQSSQLAQAKFRRTANAIPNKYIVVLNDDVVSRMATADVRRNQVSAVADSFAQQHGGKVGFKYETALVGFSIELPNEAAALAISRSPRVKYVEEDATGSIVDTQFNAPWGLDRIDPLISTNAAPAIRRVSMRSASTPYEGLSSRASSKRTSLHS